MVLGLRSKHRKGASIQLECIVHIQEMKPWPPSPSLRSVRSVVLQWENGEHSSGSFTSEVGEAKIEFNESFTLPLTLCKDKKARDKFQKNYLEFHLYEPRKDKAHHLGTAIVNLGDYGIVDGILSVGASFDFKKSSKVTMQSILSVKIQPTDKYSSNASSVGSLSKQVSLEKDGQESELVNKEIDDESIASFTDDDESSHSSRTVASSVFEVAGASPSQTEKNGSELDMHGSRMVNGETALLGGIPSMPAGEAAPVIIASKLPSGSSNILPSIEADVQQSAKDNFVNRWSGKSESADKYIQVDLSSNITTLRNSQTSGEESGQAPQPENYSQVKAIMVNDVGLDDRSLQEKKQISEDNLVGKFLASRKQSKLRSNTLASNRNIPRAQGNTVNNNKLKHLNSVQLPKAGAFSGNSQIKEKVNILDNSEAANDNLRSNTTTEIKVPTNGSCDGSVESKARIEMLEEELREAAAIEVSLYSIVAEHGGSTNKVHAPARRLSRFYLHACKGSSQEKMGNVARAAISGLALVSKACGNDVPRLTFWLSNSTMLRAIVSQAVGHMSLPVKHEESSATGKENGNPIEEYDNWKDPETFIIALEKVEAWIFSRIIESVWWQTLTPHMQSIAAKASSKSMGHGSRKSKNCLGDQEQGKFSIELWKKAFKDACERLCPVRAGGHECGCLPTLARLVMEQLVGRLDVAMFNAILRESADEMPTDPVSDPIADSKVLPVPAGRSSFGAGAQLKNAIGSWSRWLTDLFGIEDNDSPEDDDDFGDEKGIELNTSFKPFRLLNALSDLMMLPCEMLADQSTRKEVCPTFSAPLIRRVIYNFVPDEFCPNPIPATILEALDSEDNYSGEASGSGEALINFPCSATPTVYTPPPAAALAGLVGEMGSQALRRSGSSVLKKSYTSDDELDELDSPLNSIMTGNFRISSAFTRPNWKPRGSRNVIRYQLLREVWGERE